MKPIGYFKSQFKQKIDSPRQGPLTAESEIGVIELNRKENFEQALHDLDSFSHIWIIYQFHLNKNWKPMVLPPRGLKKVGVFASRSPYRPNSIGICAAELVKVKGLNIFVKKFDLLDGTPILDIKPYLTYSDSFPRANEGWLANTEKFEVLLSKNLEQEIANLKLTNEDVHKNYLKLLQIVKQQLSFDPFNKSKKRVKKITANYFEFAYRYSRIYFKQIKEKHLELDTIKI